LVGRIIKEFKMPDFGTLIKNAQIEKEYINYYNQDRIIRIT